MSGLWRGWLYGWCWLLVVIGLVLAGAGLDATDGAAELLFALTGQGAAFEWTPHLRFSTSLMGAVTLGWGLTCFPLFMAAHRLGHQAGPIWRLATGALLAWFVIDSVLSVATGFWLNAVSNTGLFAGYLIPVLASGVMRGAGEAADARSFVKT
jgi:hypothetical protein